MDLTYVEEVKITSMFAAKLIRDTIPPLKLRDEVNRALKWTEEFNVNFLPVINGKQYLGLISRVTLLLNDKPGVLIEHLAGELKSGFVYENQHVYDVVKFAALYRSDIIPVLDEQNQYMGLVTINDLVDYFALSKSVYMPGGIITIELALSDYELSKIAQIIESDGAHILSTSIATTTDPQTIEVTVKIDRVDISRILASFYRLNYNVTGSYNQSEFAEDLKDRYDSLMNYLSIG